MIRGQYSAVADTSSFATSDALEPKCRNTATNRAGEITAMEGRTDVNSKIRVLCTAGRLDPMVRKDLAVRPERVELPTF